jgi:hypothetical protein
VPKLACRACGRQIYTVVPLDSLFAEERRCPRCGAFLDTERREMDRRERIRRQNPADDPGPENVERRVAEARTCAPAAGRRGRGPAIVERTGLDRLTRPMRLAILGFGLIGGSVARALRAAGDANTGIVAWSPTRRGRARASRPASSTRAPDAASALDGVDVVLLAGPPLASIALAMSWPGRSRAELGGRRDRCRQHEGSTRGARRRRGAALRRRPPDGRPRDRGVWGRGGRPVRRSAVGRRSGAPPATSRRSNRSPARAAHGGPDDGGRPRRRRPRSATCRSWWPPPRRGGRRPADDPRPGWPVAASLAATGWRDATRLAAATS